MKSSSWIQLSRNRKQTYCAIGMLSCTKKQFYDVGPRYCFSILKEDTKTVSHWPTSWASSPYDSKCDNPSSICQKSARNYFNAHWWHILSPSEHTHAFWNKPFIRCFTAIMSCNLYITLVLFYLWTPTSQPGCICRWQFTARISTKARKQATRRLPVIFLVAMV